MDISFIIPTIERVEEVKLVLQSIKDNTPQEYSYEVLVIDQNGDNRLDNVIDDYKSKMLISHHKVFFRGVSKARNFGIELSSGDFLNFPDDDSRIMENTVKLSIDFLNKNQYSLVSGRSVDENGNSTMVKKSFMESGDLQLDKLEYQIIEYSFFATRALMLAYPFDETLGPGKFHGCYEGFDLIYRMLKNNEKMFYEPRIEFYHPQAVIDHSSTKAIMRSFTYRCGFARTLVKHHMYFRIIKRLVLNIVYLPYCLLMNRKKVRFYLAELLGIFAGIVIK